VAKGFYALVSTFYTKLQDTFAQRLS